MPPKPQLVAFDFDGVISNSIYDSMMTAVNTYIECVSDHRLPVDGPLNAHSVFTLEEQNPDFFQRFVGLMPLGNFAQDYYVFLTILQSDEDVLAITQEQFDGIRESLSESDRVAYNARFYEKRCAMQTSDPESWSTLLPPFSGIVESVPILSQRSQIGIATSKDIQSVTILLDKYELTSFFPKENILDKDFADSKRDHLIHFHESLDIPFESIHFIDDKVSHLIGVMDLGVQAHLSTWGFNGEREHEIARKHGLNLLRIEDLPRLGLDG